MWVSGLSLTFLIGLIVSFSSNQKEMKNEINVTTRVTDLNPMGICTSIGKEVGVSPYELKINPYNFPIHLDKNFTFEDGATLRFTYEDNSQVKTRQLRIFQEDADFITKSELWLDGDEDSYLLYYYLEGLKYLPKEEILALCGNDVAQFIVDIAIYFDETNTDREILALLQF